MNYASFSPLCPQLDSLHLDSLEPPADRDVWQRISRSQYAVGLRAAGSSQSQNHCYEYYSHRRTEPQLFPTNSQRSWDEADFMTGDNEYQLCTEFPPSPSDTCSSSYTDTASSSCSQPILVVCNAPLVAPIPLPYHSPTFLQFELPDIDQDLSRPPYTHRSYKRKRTKDDDVEARSVASKQTLASSPRQPSRQRPSSRDSTRRKRPQHPSR